MLYPLSYGDKQKIINVDLWRKFHVAPLLENPRFSMLSSSGKLPFPNPFPFNYPHAQKIIFNNFVDLWRIELQLHPCHGRVIPLYYRPNNKLTSLHNSNYTIWVNGYLKIHPFYYYAIFFHFCQITPPCSCVLGISNCSTWNISFWLYAGNAHNGTSSPICCKGVFGLFWGFLSCLVGPVLISFKNCSTWNISVCGHMTPWVGLRITLGGKILLPLVQADM